MSANRRYDWYPSCLATLALALAIFALVMLTYPRHVDTEARNAEPAPGSVPGPLWDDDEEVLDPFTLEPIGTAGEFREDR